MWHMVNRKKESKNTLIQDWNMTRILNVKLLPEIIMLPKKFPFVLILN